ncbi:N-acetyltransferase [Paenibacillus sediminis]|uniref:Amino-acid N-acetyltransferase n=1 Tax=Paenibacillus sediminis TaxID=664909 RepID=A0ABS4GYL9_9BACL|nr:N-acetyltransferase [Paenibacillus sediminis]MBP1935372.1 amino-acid N-acetyltransferase [Paenibacillus sediminis]
MPAVCRQATVDDIETLYLMIQGYAEKGIMLPRSRKVLERQISNFVVADLDGEVIGCGSLCRLGHDLVEIRSLGISEGHKGKGVGSMLVSFLVEEARSQSIPKVMALTYEVSFFQKNGFQVVNKEIFPEKVWTDCVHCSKQNHCDEIAVLKILN